MMKLGYLTTTALALVASQASAQDSPAPPAAVRPPEPASPAQPESQGDIVVTAQRQSQRLQDVPIAITAVDAKAIESRQIVNTAVLTQALPGITFSKNNFVGASFTIRGIGDLCNGSNCDQATAIHVNDMPLLSTRLFETEFFDLERIEVLRGPQGTLFGRNATAGVANVITARPDLTGVHADGEIEYGNYDNKRARAMLNLPLGDTVGVRVAGTYLKRDGFTRNLFDGSRIDDRDLYAVRGTVSWKPDPDTRLDLMAYYFHENDNRMRFQKQLCNRDDTGVLGCSPDRLENESANGNASLANVLSSREFLRVALGQTPFAAFSGLFGNLGLQSLYGANGSTGVAVPADRRTVNTDYRPSYFAEEEQYMGKFFHDFGPVTLNLTGGYTRNKTLSRSDYTLSVQNPLTNNSGLVLLDQIARLGAGAPVPGLATIVPGTGLPLGTLIQGPLAAVRNALIPNGPAGGACQTDIDAGGVGVFGGRSIGCFANSRDYDESTSSVSQWSAEAHVDSHFDGPFNFLLGGIFVRSTLAPNRYDVSSFGLDYAAGLLGAIDTLAARLGGAPTTPPLFRASPFYRAITDRYRLNSYGIFGEAYLQASDKLKLTLGLRYNNDRKTVRSRTLLLTDANGVAVDVPYGADSIEDAINFARLDFDRVTAGAQQFNERSAKFDRLTGRAVAEYEFSRNNMAYASYSRGYKAGGLNLSLPASFGVPETYRPETIDAFEIGTKNSFGGGALRLNASAFYYRYNDLQVVRWVSQTAVNDNIDADIYGVEAEAVIAPIRAFQVNANFSYTKTRIRGDQLIENPRDPSGGRADAVIIKNLTNASNCAVVPNGSNAAAANAYVAAVNAGLGLRAPTAVPGTNATGAYGLCSTLASLVAAPTAALRTAFGVPTGALPFTVLGSGVPTNVRGNALPQTPTFKVSVGAQYTAGLGGSGWRLVPRVDLNYTGEYYASIFNLPIDRVPGYALVNAQLQLDAPDDRFFVRAFVQNLTGSDAITGQFVSDQSTGLFTNVFVVEPRRYGVAAGFRF